MATRSAFMMKKPTCLITGATSGIGKAAAFALAGRGCQMVLLGRSAEKLGRTIAEIRKKENDADVHPYVCDFSLIQDVRDLASKMRKAHDRIDVLINNAGARFLHHGLTREGMELTLVTNHLGHFVLTLSLMEALERSDGARIINVASGAHFGGTGVIENIVSEKGYDGRLQYANSKLANVLFTYALAEKLLGRRVAVNAVDPGGVATNFARNNGWFPWLRHRLAYLRSGSLLTPEQGAETIVYLAESGDAEGVSGKYFRNKKEQKSSALSYDRETQERLWAASVAWSGIGLV
jgi:NAD(P)-dependent dehydrogenase (short-subunit alcohol dehydrogenase family)